MQHPRSDIHTPRENDDCEALAPFVMALFDGEADELEARRARAHLLVCQMCARRWLDWNRSRDLLRAVPVPAPPPTLLWRVLMACRLAAFSRKRRLGLDHSLGLASSRVEKTGLEFAPRDLSAQILARTTRAEASPSHPSKRRVFPVFALPSLAVPALAIWLIALGGSAPWVASPPATPLPSATPQRAAAPRRVKTSAPSLAAPRRAIAPARKLALSSAPKPPAPRRAAATRAQVTLSPVETPKREVEAAPVAPQPVMRTTPRFVAVALSRAPVSLRLVAAPRARPLAATPRISTAPRLSASHDTPQLRTARWEVAARREDAALELAASGAAPSRVSPPTAPAPAPPLLLAENFEADDDESVEEMRSVVDDFRAALDPDGFQTIDFEGDAG